MVEATEGCDINPGKYASIYSRSFVISKLEKHATRRFVQTKTSQENSQFLDCHEILHAKQQGGGG
jgi:hypothetical protein